MDWSMSGKPKLDRHFYNTDHHMPALMVVHWPTNDGLLCRSATQEGEESYAKCSGLHLKTVVLAFNTL